MQPLDLPFVRPLTPLQALAIQEGRYAALPSILTTPVQPEPPAAPVAQLESEASHAADAPD